MKIKKGGNVSRMLEGIPIPDMFRAEQAFDKSHIEPAEIPSIVRRELSRPEIADTIKPGMSIAITAGNRGVANVDTITRAIVDFITKRMFDKLDPEMIYPNCFTSTVIRSGMMPPVVATDKEAIQACILTANQIDKKRPRIVRIKNTLHVGRIMLSEVYYEDVRAGKYPGLTALDEPAPLVFDEDENLL